MFAVSNNTINSPLQGTGKFFEWFNLGIDSLAIPSIKPTFPTSEKHILVIP